jgi:hypothetical protein
MLFTADRKTDELRTLAQRLTKLRESIAAANRRSRRAWVTACPALSRRRAPLV